jgi:hypothetical protein
VAAATVVVVVDIKTTVVTAMAAAAVTTGVRCRRVAVQMQTLVAGDVAGVPARRHRHSAVEAETTKAVEAMTA